MENLRSCELVNVAKFFEDYSPGVEIRCWGIVSEWLYEICKAFKLKYKTRTLSLKLFNDYCSQVDVPKNSLQMYGCASVYIALNIHNELIFEDDFINISDNSFTKEEFQEAVNRMIVQLDGKLHPPTVTSVLHSILFENEGAKPEQQYAELISEILYVQFPQFISVDPYDLACACISLSEKLVENEIIEKTELENNILYHLKMLSSTEFKLAEEPGIVDLFSIVRNRPCRFVRLPMKPRVLRSKEVKSENECIQFIRTLGRGVCGKVDLYKKGDEFFARKTQKQYDLAYVELALLSTYKHNNIIEMKDFSVEGDELIIDLVSGIPLAELIPATTNTDDWKTVYLDFEPAKLSIKIEQKRQIQLDILLGLEYLHSHGIIHCDLKVPNIVIVDGVAKIIDFGLAYVMCLSKKDNSIKDIHVYTATNRPMELLYKPEQNNRYAFEVDIWAVATVLLEIETDVVPFLWDVESELTTSKELCGNEAVIWSISKLLGTPNDDKYTNFLADNPSFNFQSTQLMCVKNVHFRELLLEMLIYNPKKRPVISDVVRMFKALSSLQ